MNERTLRRWVAKGKIPKPRQATCVISKKPTLKLWTRAELDRVLGERVDRATACRLLGVASANLGRYVQSAGKGQVLKADLIAAIKKRGTVNETVLAWLLGLTPQQAWFLCAERFDMAESYIDPKTEEYAYRWDEIEYVLPPRKLRDMFSPDDWEEFLSYRTTEPDGYREEMLQREEFRRSRPMDEDERRRERIEREAKRAERQRRRAWNVELMARVEAAFKATLDKSGPEAKVLEDELKMRVLERDTLWQKTNKRAIKEWWEAEGKQETSHRFAKVRRARALN